MNNLEFAKEMQARTKAFAVQVVKFFGKLPKTDDARSGTSVAPIWNFCRRELSRRLSRQIWC